MNINQEIVVAAQFSTDGKGFKRDGNAHSPYASTAEFLTAIPSTRRHNGQIAWIANGSVIELWHFVGGIDDEDLVQFSIAQVTSIVTETTNDDFPDAGLDNVIYVNSTTKTPYIWDGSSYQVIGNPGPAGAKGDKGDKGDTGDTGEKGDKGDTGATGDSAITVRTNGTNNAVQDVLDLIDSPFIAFEYIGTGQVKAKSKCVRFKIGDGNTGTPASGATAYVNADMIGLDDEDYSVWRNGTVLTPGVEYDNEPTGGGFTLKVSGDLFGDDEQFLIR